jgi:hypothetical protein
LDTLGGRINGQCTTTGLTFFTEGQCAHLGHRGRCSTSPKLVIQESAVVGSVRSTFFDLTSKSSQ